MRNLKHTNADMDKIMSTVLSTDRIEPKIM